MRCAHESRVPRRLISELQYGECGVISDWKAKWLCEVFREPMSDFFGKTGIPLMGTMFYTPTVTGELDIVYVDATMAADGKEDGVAAFAAFKLSVQHFKADHHWVTIIRWVRTDGAGCYSGLEFTLGMAMMTSADGLPIGGHYIGEGGNNKNSQDGHFATLGRAVSRQVDSGHQDVDCEAALAQAITKLGLANTTAILFTPDRSFTLKLAPIADLKLMSERIFEKCSDGATVSLCLRQQTGLGVGKVLKLSDLLIDDQHSSM